MVACLQYNTFEMVVSHLSTRCPGEEEEEEEVLNMLATIPVMRSSPCEATYHSECCFAAPGPKSPPPVSTMVDIFITFVLGSPPPPSRSCSIIVGYVSQISGKPTIADRGSVQSTSEAKVAAK